MCWSDYRRGLDWLLDILNTYTHNTQLPVTVELLLIRTFYSSLQRVLSLLSLLCLHQSLPGDESQQCPLLPCSRSYLSVTVPQVTHCCQAGDHLTPTCCSSHSRLETLLEREREIYFTTDGLPPICSSWRQASWDLRPEFFKLNTCCHRLYVTFSLMRGWVRRLQLLLALASAFILRSEYRRTHDDILLSQIQDSPNLEPRSPYLYPPGTGWPSCTPRHWVPFPSPFTTHRVTVEVIRTLLHTL
jgi:hypothetical protein